MIEHFKEYCRRLYRFVRGIPELFSELIRTLKNCWAPVLLFLVLCSFANLVITTSVLRLLLELLLKLSGYRYLGPDNLKTVMLSPWALLLAIPALNALILPPIFEVSALFHAYGMSSAGEKPAITGMIRTGLRACERTLHPKNWLLVLFFAVLLPLTGLVSFSSGSLTVVIPEFIRDFITANLIYNNLYNLLTAALLFLELTVIFLLCFYIPYKENVLPSCRRSARLIRGRRVMTLCWLLAINLAFYMFSVAVSSLISEGAARLQALFSGAKGSLTAAELMKNHTLLLRAIISDVLAPAVNVAGVWVLFRAFSREDGAAEESFPVAKNKGLRPVQVVSMALAVLLFASMLAFRSLDGSIGDAAPRRPAIVAHRGDSVNAPENTMPAFRLAALLNPDWVEFDVHETKDGEIIVSHDDDLSRVTGQALFVHELTLEEIMALDSGAWFSEDYRGTGFSTLEETLQFFQETDLALQIEIKPSGHDTDLEEKVIALIKDSGIADRCVITCLSLEPLLRVEELAPEIVTVYSMFVAWGHVDDLPVDGYTIEEGNITRELADTIHNAGKFVFAWTANTEDTVQYLYDCGVDGILTDDPSMLRNALNKAQVPDGLLRELRLNAERIKKGL